MQVRILMMCKVLLSVKICEIIRSVEKCQVLYYSVQALVSGIFSSAEVGDQVLGWVEAVAAR